MEMLIKLIPQSFIDEYDLQYKTKVGFDYIDIMKGMQRLTPAGILANQLLKKILDKIGYSKVPHTPSLMQNLVVDDFGIKYVNIQDAEHLRNTLKGQYKLEIDWTGKINCGITFYWNCEDKYVDISSPGYTK